MEKIVERTLLFDFYGDLLTEHQQKIYEDVVLNDTGYSEVAAREGISRQGVHDLIRRCDRQLDEYESKLRLVERFLLIRKNARQIQSEARDLLAGVPRLQSEGREPLTEGDSSGRICRILELTDQILEVL